MAAILRAWHARSRSPRTTDNVSRSMVIIFPTLHPLQPRGMRSHACCDFTLIDATAHWPERGALGRPRLGTKTIGVAVSDPIGDSRPGRNQSSARPSNQMRRASSPSARKRNAVGFVLGCPSHGRPQRGPRAPIHPRLRAQFSKLTIWPPYAWWDERSPPSAVERELIDMDMTAPGAPGDATNMPRIYILQGRSTG